MGALLSVIAVVLISMLINRFATIALSLTGMSSEEARFQARAAMSGVGLTTRRPEDIVAHPHGLGARIAELDQRTRDASGDEAHARASAEENSIEEREHTAQREREGGGGSVG